MEATSAYGVRLYQNLSSLVMHQDKVRSENRKIEKNRRRKKRKYYRLKWGGRKKNRREKSVDGLEREGRNKNRVEKRKKRKEEGGEFDNSFQSIILCNTIIHYILLHYISYV